MPKSRPTPQLSRRGVASILTLLALPVVLLFAWFCLEYARIHRHAGRAKAAADAAALAAAARYADGPDAARADAVSAAAGHEGPSGPLVIVAAEGPGGGGDLEFGDWDPDARAFTHDPDRGGKAVRATVHLSADHPNGGIPLLLGGFFGIGPASAHHSSVAVFRAPTHTTSLLLADAAGSTLSLGGASTLRARGGVSVPNADAAAIAIGAGAAADLPVIRAAGTVDDEAEARVDGSVQEGATVPADPFAGVELPAIDMDAPASVIEAEDGATVRVGPGLHEALSAAAGTVVLEQGLHQFNGGISLSGSAVLLLEDATVQLPEGAALELAGSAAIRGTSGSGVAAWNGCSIVQRPGSAAWSVAGDAVLEPAGRLYAPGAQLALSDSAQATLRSAVLRSLSLAGASRARFTSDIDELALQASPGRARLVR